jgi:hypothetical protein
MQWFGRLVDRLTGSVPNFPAMFRVRNADGEVVPLVDLDGTFEPIGKRFRKSQVTAAGLCMVEWPPEARSLRVHISAREQSAAVEVASRRDDPERVIEVRLA